MRRVTALYVDLTSMINATPMTKNERMVTKTSISPPDITNPQIEP